MASIPKEKLPAHVRRCYEAWRKANDRNRDAEIERLKFYAGGEGQWREEEVQKRKQQQRPIITVNKCKPAVDQIEGDIRLNPPGPQCHPVGSGADADTADIIEGLIRETEYRSGARVAYSTAGKYVAASGYAVLELATEYANDRSFSQRLVIKSVEDPSCVFYDPTARMANRQDAGWAGKLKMYNRVDYIAEFGETGADGKTRKILEKRNFQTMMGWIQDAMGTPGEMALLNEWTGMGDGPFYVCEFYQVEIEPIKLQMYRGPKGAEIAFFEDETIPPGFKPMVDQNDKNRYTREVPRRKIMKYLVDAFDVLKTTEWMGSLIPLFPVLGPEVYIDGKLHRLSLIAGAIDSQRALNYAATTAIELAGAMPKSPWIGAKGAFTDPRWQMANSETFAYLEYTPVLTPDEMGNYHPEPPPKRNLYEMAIQWVIALKQAFSDDIKAVTAIYDPSLGQVKGGQSGVAIEQLRSESSVGNYSYSDNLHRAIEVMYQEMCVIFPKILDGARVVTIVKPDSQHEVKEINRVFGEDGIDPATGQKGKTNNITLGEYSVRVTIGPGGPSKETRDTEAVGKITEIMKANPGAFQSPQVAAQVIRMIGDGNPKIEALADLISPPNNEASVQQMGQQLQAEQQKVGVLTQMLQEMHQEMQAKLPEIEAKKWQTAVESLTKIHVAEITASKDMDKLGAEQEAALLEQLIGMAHEHAKQKEDQEHAMQTQAADQAHASASQAADHEAAAEQAEMTSANKKA